MLLSVEKRSLAKTKDEMEASRTFFRSLAGTAIRQVIIPPIILNLPKQKNSYNLDNFQVDDYKYRG